MTKKSLEAFSKYGLCFALVLLVALGFFVKNFYPVFMHKVSFEKESNPKAILLGKVLSWLFESSPLLLLKSVELNKLLSGKDLAQLL